MQIHQNDVALPGLNSKLVGDGGNLPGMERRAMTCLRRDVGDLRQKHSDLETKLCGRTSFKS